MGGSFDLPNVNEDQEKEDGEGEEEEEAETIVAAASAGEEQYYVQLLRVRAWVLNTVMHLRAQWCARYWQNCTLSRDALPCRLTLLTFSSQCLTL